MIFSDLETALDGTFANGPSGARIQGGFYGPGHAEAVGIFQQSDILGACGATRQQAPIERGGRAGGALSDGHADPRPGPALAARMRPPCASGRLPQIAGPGPEAGFPSESGTSGSGSTALPQQPGNAVWPCAPGRV